MAEPSSMTFVMKHEATGWKVTSWTYSAAGLGCARQIAQAESNLSGFSI